MSTNMIDYKCLVCGNFESFPSHASGMSCKTCGSRIFQKPRRSGHKTLDAN